MKKISTVLLLIAITAAAAVAQEYKAFRVGIGLGYANASGKGAKGGVLWSLEPGYRVNDQILANLRIEGAVIGRGYADETSASVDVAALGSYTLNGQYYFNNNSFRPFVGVGFGMYSLAAVSMTAGTSGGSSQAVAAANKIGFYPRVGFDAGHFTLNLDYNIVPETAGIKNSYLGIRIGGFFGGGKK
ncbi:MAG TPA: outer membrane beta-barrel protein [Chryseosolibacter sp.]